MLCLARCGRECLEREPSVVAPHLEDFDDFGWLSDLLERMPGVFEHLPAHFQHCQWLLYKALERDDALRSEFLETASKKEVNEWRWQRSSCDKIRRRHEREARTVRQSRRRELRKAVM